MGKRVFVLDDDEAILSLLENLLVKAGYEVATRASSVGATLEIRKFRPDIVVLDIMIPEMSGDSLVELINKNVNPAPKIIFYSSKPVAELFKLSQELNVEGYVCKKDGPNALMEKIKSLL